MLVSAKNKKRSHFSHFNDHNSRVNMITKQMTPFFSSTRRALFTGIFIFAFLDLQNSVLWDPPLHYVLVCKIHIYMPKMTLWSMLKQISFFYIKSTNFWYITCFALNLIPIWSRSYGPYWKNRFSCIVKSVTEMICQHLGLKFIKVPLTEKLSWATDILVFSYSRLSPILKRSRWNPCKH